MGTGPRTDVWCQRLQLYQRPAGSRAQADIDSPVERRSLGDAKAGGAVLVAVSLWGLAIAAFGIVPWLPAALALLAVAGAADVFSAVFRGTILQTEAPDALRGRVSSIHTAVVTGGPRLGDVEAGGVAALAGAQTSVISGGLGCLVGVALVWRLMPALAAYLAPGPGAAGLGSTT